MLKALNQLHRPAAVVKNLTLNFFFVEKTPERFIGDASRLRQIVNNLVGNAIKFTPSGGRIDVTVQARPISQTHSELFIFVQDTGPGIQLADQKRIFERFEQIDNHPLSNATGTGLGLAITKELAVAMGGDVTVESDGQTGTRFTVHVPFALDISLSPYQADAPTPDYKRQQAE